MSQKWLPSEGGLRCLGWVEELEPSVLLVPLLEDDELDEDEAELPPLAALLSSENSIDQQIHFE